MGGGVECRVSGVVCRMSYVVCRMSYVVCRMSYVVAGEPGTLGFLHTVIATNALAVCRMPYIIPWLLSALQLLARIYHTLVLTPPIFCPPAS
jgi:hypothetical protein